MAEQGQSKGQMWSEGYKMSAIMYAFKHLPLQKTICIVKVVTKTLPLEVIFILNFSVYQKQSQVITKILYHHLYWFKFL